MTATVVTGGTLTLEGDGPMHVEDVLFVGPKYETYKGHEPDPAWSQADANGHEHRWMRPLADEGRKKADPVLPTATRTERREPCDGACGDPDHEWTIVEWWCVQCGEQVDPGYRTATFQMEVRPGEYEIAVAWEPAPDVTSVTLSELEARNRPARLQWPSGPGKMLDLAGAAWSVGGLEGECGFRGTAFRRRFVFRPAWEESDA